MAVSISWWFPSVSVLEIRGLSFGIELRPPCPLEAPNGLWAWILVLPYEGHNTSNQLANPSSKHRVHESGLLLEMMLAKLWADMFRHPLPFVGVEAPATQRPCKRAQVQSDRRPGGS